MSKLYIYYWNEILNLGDVLNQFIIQSLTDDNVEYKNIHIKKRTIIKSFIYDILFRQNNFKRCIKGYVPPTTKILFSIGSILDWADKNSIVWGSGFRERYSRTRSKNIHAVRGFLTRSLLPARFSDIKVGDPALLLPLILPMSTNKSDSANKISVIAHFKDKELECIKNTSYNKIDIQTSDIKRFVLEILSSDFVLSSSLHGVIISHAYGVPALWIRGGDTGSSDFKFYDYFSVFSLDENYPVLDADEVLSLSRVEIVNLFDRYRFYSKPDQEAISSIQRDLLKSAPFKLNGQYNKLL